MLNQTIPIQAMTFKVGCCLLLSVFVIGCKNEAENKTEQPKQADVEKEKPAPAPVKRPNLLKRKTKEVADKYQAMADNPKLIEVENKITGKDPLTVSLQGYIAMSSKVNVLNFQHQINLMRAMNDRNPTYKEIVELIKTTRMEFNALPDYQTFAYDEKEGKFLILEDPEEKKRLKQQ